jgi:aerobic carbon-monoxide dehydrogenase large subunit
VDRKHVGTAYIGLNNRELAAGRGTFVSDIQLPDMAYMVVVRSVFAHARIVSVDTSAAEAVEGVLAVMTGQEARQVFKPIPEGWNTAEVGAKHVDWYPLVHDRARYVGEAIAAVVADSTHVAQLAWSTSNWTPSPTR